MKTATEKQILKPVKISKKIPARELRRTLARAIPVLLTQEKIIKSVEADLADERTEREQAIHDAVHKARTEENVAHWDIIHGITSQLHDNGILANAKYTCAFDIAPAIISRVNQIAADFSKARDEQLAVAARAHHEGVLAVEKRLELAYEDMRAKYEAEVELNKMSEHQLREAETSAHNAWRTANDEHNAADKLRLALRRAQRPWWRKAWAWVRGTGK